MLGIRRWCESHAENEVLKQVECKLEGEAIKAGLTKTRENGLDVNKNTENGPKAVVFHLKDHRQKKVIPLVILTF